MTILQNDQPDKHSKWEAHAWLRKHSARKGGRMCMNPLVGVASVGVTAAGVAHMGGVFRCASLGGCPVCGPTMRQRKHAVISELLTKAHLSGCRVMFVTATASHSAANPLADTYRLVASSWSAAFSGQAALNPAYLGQIRVLEVTHGVNGWHPHVHGVIVLDRMSERRAKGFCEAAGTRYRQAVRARGGRVSNTRHGFDVQSARSVKDIAAYIAKIDSTSAQTAATAISFELVRGDLKTAGGVAGRSPAQILRDAVDGSLTSKALYNEYEVAIKGKHLISIGRKLAARFDVVDLPDDLCAEAEVSGEIVLTFSFAAGAWRHFADTGQLGAVAAACSSFVRDGERLPDWVLDAVTDCFAPSSP